MCSKKKEYVRETVGSMHTLQYLALGRSLTISLTSFILQISAPKSFHN